MIRLKRIDGFGWFLFIGAHASIGLMDWGRWLFGLLLWDDSVEIGLGPLLVRLHLCRGDE
ncbi:hypothetical protein LV780_04825 [Cereibacter azotoformans]|uniref:hypothetical protein n=1 Tax=Cereibacter azotoformans TaxID=43057 RepID=UPI000E35BD52|nr:hypothetical protein [Cereibacter azotoformans]AXQ93193.1 hypothetical protein D0Z66_04815 [Cereibacter sphaeroides]UIJ31504.1 hypothetical protein LV780_04825 [Cereibacter azotoformans]